MPRTGLEPARLAAHAPETCASTNSATWALFLNSYKVILNVKEQGAENETRTRDPNLGKVVLYQLSYFRDCGCKGRHFFLTDKLFQMLFLEKMRFLFLIAHTILIISPFCFYSLRKKTV